MLQYWEKEATQKTKQKQKTSNDQKQHCSNENFFWNYTSTVYKLSKSRK